MQRQTIGVMNFKTATFRAALAERGMTVARLAKSVKIHPKQLRHMLNESRRGRLTWRRIEDAIDARERALLVELYGPVFGEEPVNELYDEFFVPEAPMEDEPESKPKRGRKRREDLLTPLPPPAQSPPPASDTPHSVPGASRPRR